ncbi:MAG: type IV pilus secretin PilQ [Terriglobia bacterium]
MMRKPWGALGATLLLVGLVSSSEIGAAESRPEPSPPLRLLAVKAAEQPAGTSLRVMISGPFSFTSYQPDERTLIVDLAGVVADAAALPPGVEVAWIASYRLLPFRNASGRPVLRLDINLKRDCAVEVGRAGVRSLLLSCPDGARVSAASAASEPLSPPGVPATAPSSDKPLRVRRAVVHDQAGGVVVDIRATGPLAYETQTLSSPTRLVVDLPQSILLSRQRVLPIEKHAVLRLRMGQFKAQPPITRLVVDLREMIPYEIKPTPQGLRLTLRASPAPAPVPESGGGGTPAPPSPVPAGAFKQAPVETASSPSESPPVLLASLAPTVSSSVGSTPASDLTAEMTVPASAAAVPSPAAELPSAADQATAPPQAIPTPTPPAQRPQKFTGEPVSVNLKDVDLKDFFRLIHEISGLNIVLDPNVSGTVTLVLIDVPWDQALDIVLRNNSLGSSLDGNVLRIATLETLRKEQEQQRDLVRARDQAVELITVTRELSYAQASDLEPTLQRFLSTRGEVIRDDRTNTLIIRDIPSVIPAVDNLIQQLDRKSLQVEIEARVVSASRAFAREIGTQFATSFQTTRGRSTFGGALGPSPFSGLPPPPLVSGTFDPLAPVAVPQPLATNLPAEGATSGFLFGHRSANFALDIILTAAESRNIAKVLSKPRLITQNNIQGEVKQGTRIPVQTVVNNTISVQFLDVVLRLSVKPQITAEGTVFLDVLIENTAIDPGIARINGIPALATQSTTTQVLIPDGGTVVIGGVMVTDNATTIDQVPLLGSIPVIGHLFKRTRVTTKTQELLFFITPRILQG